MDMTQTLNAQLAMMMFFALIPMLGMMQARRSQRAKIKIFLPEELEVKKNLATMLYKIRYGD